MKVQAFFRETEKGGFYYVNRIGLRMFFRFNPHWTHEGFSAAVGINPRTLRRILDGSQAVGERTRKKIVRRFGVYFA